MALITNPLDPQTYGFSDGKRNTVRTGSTNASAAFQGPPTTVSGSATGNRMGISGGNQAPGLYSTAQGALQNANGSGSSYDFNNDGVFDQGMGGQATIYSPNGVASNPAGGSGNTAPVAGRPAPGDAAYNYRPPTQDPGNNLTNPGYTEQAWNYTQEQYLNNPWMDNMSTQYGQTQQASPGEQFINQNLGSLSGPGQGEQYWNQMQGQYMNPYAGEQFTRQATQNFAPSGASGAFNNNLQGQYNDFVNYQGAGNSQGQYGASRGELGGGTQAEANMANIAGNYSQYGGGNNALGQYQQNAGSGPLAAQSFYNQVGGSYDSMGRYTDPNLAAGQYAQTQGAFGDMPIANFDPFYDRASQLATQDYNRQAAGRGVYGSSEALSGVGNVITDIEAQRANRSFDAEMQRAQEQRMRQQLLGEQARMGDLSGQGAFAANLAGLETYGNLANQAGNQTLAQQTMLGNQARAADQTGLDAFQANTNAATAYGNINNQMGQLQLDRNRLLGDLANNADTQATSAQNARVSGVNALSSAANNADRNEIDRYTQSTNAMNQADRMQLDRTNAGADAAFKVDDTNRANYDSEATAANNAARLNNDRTRLGADISQAGSNMFTQGLNDFMSNANLAENSRQARQNSKMDAMFANNAAIQSALANNYNALISGDDAQMEDVFNTSILPELQKQGASQAEIQQTLDAMKQWAASIKEAKKNG